MNTEAHTSARTAKTEPLSPRSPGQVAPVGESCVRVCVRVCACVFICTRVCGD
jgi:hypothetical protein